MSDKMIWHFASFSAHISCGMSACIVVAEKDVDFEGKGKGVMLNLRLVLKLRLGLNLRLNTKARAWQLMGLRSKTKRPRQEWNPFSQRWFGILWQRTSWYWNIKRPLVRNYPPSAYWWASGDRRTPHQTFETVNVCCSHHHSEKYYLHRSSQGPARVGFWSSRSEKWK